MIADSLKKGRFLLLVSAGCVLPWCVVLFICSGLITLINFLFLLLVLSGLGYIVLAGVDGELTVGDRMLLSPAAGYVVACGTIALATRLGCSAGLSFWVISVVGLVGAVLYSRVFRSVQNTEVSLGYSYVILAVLVCLIYFIPGALRDAVILKDGAFNWMYVDTQYSMAVAASVKASISSPKWPGLGIAPLEYHFGTYALSGALSAATGIELADAYARVVRGASQIILLVSTIGMSRILSRQAGDVYFAGLMGAIGLFFCGSLGSLFADRITPSTFITAPIPFNLPFTSLPGEGGPFSHIILGHSLMNGMIGINAVLGVLLAKTGFRHARRMGPDISCFLPGLLATINGVAGLGVFGVYIGTLLILGRKHLRAIATCLIAAVVFFVVLKVMGFVGSSSMGQMELNTEASGLLFETFVWFFIGLGIRVFAMKWINNSWGSAACIIVLLFITGYLFYSIGIIDYYDGHQRRGIKFLETILSVFAFVALAEPVNAYMKRKRAELDAFWDDLMGILFSSGVIFLLVASVAYTMERTRNNPDTGTLWHLKITIICSLLVVMSSWLIRSLIKKNLNIALLVKAGMVAVFFWGGLAWIPSWLNYGLGRMKLDIRVSKGEVDGLRRLRVLSKHSDLIATNHQLVSSTPLSQSDFTKMIPRNIFYTYSALLERKVLLEGWDYGEKYQPIFSKVKRDNDVLFNTTNPDEAHAIVQRYRINYLIARPGTDVLFADGAKAWLRLLPYTGTLKVYEVFDDTDHRT